MRGISQSRSLDIYGVAGANLNMGKCYIPYRLLCAFRSTPCPCAKLPLGFVLAPGGSTSGQLLPVGDLNLRYTSSLNGHGAIGAVPCSR